MRVVTQCTVATERRWRVKLRNITSLGNVLGSRVVSVLDSGAEGPGSNRSRDAVGLQGPLVIRRSHLTFIEIIKPNGCICNPVWWNLRSQYLNNRKYNAMNSTKSHFIAKYNQCK